MTELALPALVIEEVELVETGPRLVLANRSPGPGETQVPIDSLLALELIDSGPTGVRLAGLRIWVGETLAVEGSTSPPILPPFAGPRSSLDQTSDSVRVVLHPVVPLESLALISMRVVAQTADGEAQLEAQYAFTVEDRTPPRLLAAQAVAPRQVKLAFDEEVEVPAGASFSFVPEGRPAVTLKVIAVSLDATLLWLTLDTELTPDVRYLVTVAGVSDSSGNEIMPPYDRAQLVGFRPAQPPGRRFDLWQMIPAHNRRDDQTGDLRGFIACLQEVVDLLLSDLDRWPQLFDLERAPERFLDLILRDLGNPFSFSLDLPTKRRLAAVLVELYRQKGTAPGIRNAVRFFLGVDITAIVPLAAEALVLGESELGVDWVMGPSHRFALYAFDVVVARALTQEERARLRHIVEYMRPAHTHFVTLVEPRPPEVPDHWELGESDLGETTALH
ncbi:MAG: Ig-like domain-containing protein [Myxococcales bacterium]|nr:Ig-like domain-containing protein [Myxococcales bacterium]